MKNIYYCITYVHHYNTIVIKTYLKIATDIWTSEDFINKRIFYNPRPKFSKGFKGSLDYFLFSVLFLPSLSIIFLLLFNKEKWWLLLPAVLH